MPQLEGRGSARLRTQAMDRGGSIAPDQRAKGMYLDAQGGAGEGKQQLEAGPFYMQLERWGDKRERGPCGAAHQERYRTPGQDEERYEEFTIPRTTWR